MSIGQQIEVIQQNINEALSRRACSGMSGPQVKLVAVTKNQGVTAMQEAIDSGITTVGENRIQEAVGKKNQLDRQVEWHLIGHLQTNKVGQAVAAFPNPFSQETTLSFNLENESLVTVSIMDVSGSLIKTYSQVTLYAGEHSLRWDGKNDAGSSVRSGIYFYQVNIDGVIRSGKLILNR